MPRHFLSGAMYPFALFLASAALVPAGAQTPQSAPAAANPGAFDLSVRNIMRGEGLVGRSPNEVRWSEDSRWVYFRWRDPESRDTTTSVYRVPVGGGTPQRLADSVADRTAPPVAGRWSADRRRRAVERSGDIYVVDTTGREWRITDTPVRERSPHLSGDARTVYFLSGSNVFAVPVEGGPIRQLTDIRTEDQPQRKPAEGQRRHLEEQQTELFDVIRDRVAERRHREARDSVRTTVRPLYLGRNGSVASAEVSPSGRYLLLGVNDRVEERQTLVPNFVTESGYTEPVNVRSKVGDVQQGQRMALVELATGKTTWLQPESANRRITLTSQGWAPGEDRALLIGIPFDYKDRWIYTVGPDGKLTTVDHLRDDAWVGGPGIFTAAWLPDGRVYFVSERSGYAHLYTVPAAGGEATAVTSGEWEVTDVQLSPDGRTFFLTTSETHPGERSLYTVPAAGGRRTRITPLEGWSESIVSPDGRNVAVLHSVANRPPELYLIPNRPGATARRVTESTTAEFRRGPWIRPEVITFPARDGATVYARIFRPRELGARPNGAAVLFVHGAGYLQNAHRGWSTYFREYMFHHLLASRGYTVLDVDYRGSAGYGGRWRTGIYRHMGGKDLTDQVDGVRWLVQNEGIDPKRVGIYGGSYGGFITLMGMFTEPDVFRSGAALRSVTDWAHYNHGYTSRILNQPQDDPEAYRRSSPIYFAQGLRGDLLIAHGMMDVNVHFQDVVRLTQRLIELGKTNWELAVYPVEDHAFVRPESWTDEYRRILELFERTLRPTAAAN
ncbi:MAG TPA: alpha/beta fold hydrolase [Longimicrobiaceae bacterium]|nr:alpha/beta fold hydrolase [Longimicrobiaceae bacterium]